MHINKSTVTAFLDQIEKKKTHDAYRATLNNFSDFCGGRIETDRADKFLEQRRSVGRANRTVECDRSVIKCLERYAVMHIGTKTVSPRTAPAKPEPKRTVPDPILAAFEKCDATALAFAATKLTEAYNAACEAVKKVATPVKWDAESWDKASDRAKNAYNGLRRVKDVLDLVNKMWEVKAGVTE